MSVGFHPSTRPTRSGDRIKLKNIMRSTSSLVKSWALLAAWSCTRCPQTGANTGLEVLLAHFFLVLNQIPLDNCQKVLTCHQWG
jgi:hypothetical protein